MELKNQIRAFVLQAIKAADGEPLQDSVLRSAIRQRFSNVTHTEADITSHIEFCQGRGWIIGTDVELAGVVWKLTPKGTLQAAQLG